MFCFSLVSCRAAIFFGHEIYDVIYFVAFINHYRLVVGHQAHQLQQVSLHDRM